LLKNAGSFLERGFKKFLARALPLLARDAPPSPDPASPKSFLLLRPDRLGDFILALPALQALQKNIPPGSRVTLVAGERSQELARFFFPGFEVLVFPKNLWGRLALYRRLWAGRFDAVADLHSNPFSTTSAFMTLLPRSLFRVGFVDPSQPLSGKVFNRPVPLDSGQRHEREKNLMLVGKLLERKNLDFRGLPALDIPGNIREKAEDFYRMAGFKKGDFVVGFHPTLLKQDNRWSQENYLRLVKALGKGRPVRMVVVWGRGEEGSLEEFKGKARGIPGLYFLPTCDLLFLLEAARRFSVFVCNDSGLMHLVSLVSNVLAVFGPSHPGQWKPVGKKRVRIFRTPDGKCDSVPPEAVAAGIRKMFLKGTRWQAAGGTLS
jgi:ADP-heptose:LPS heptosyltransferase